MKNPLIPSAFIWTDTGEVLEGGLIRGPGALADAGVHGIEASAAAPHARAGG